MNRHRVLVVGVLLALMLAGCKTLGPTWSLSVTNWRQPFSDSEIELLADRAKSRLGSLSGGMVRRVGVAQAIMHDPRLLIADEPAAGLDPEERLRLFDNFRAVASERPALISSHSVEEIEREADHVWFLREGRLAWSGTVRDAIKEMQGRVRQGELPEGEQPVGTVVSRKQSAGGNMWRVIGSDSRLPACDPTLLDAYFEHVGRASNA